MEYFKDAFVSFTSDFSVKRDKNGKKPFCIRNTSDVKTKTKVRNNTKPRKGKKLLRDGWRQMSGHEDVDLFRNDNGHAE